MLHLLKIVYEKIGDIEMKRFLVFLAIFSIFSHLFGSAELYSQEPDEDLDVSELQKTMQLLESQDYLNRYPGSNGNELTETFLLEKIQSLNLKPFNGVIKQDFNITIGLELKDNNLMELTKLVERPGLPKERWGKATKTWSPGNEYLPISFSSNGTVEGEMAFVGYGITAPELNYDDYAGIDVKDKIVIVLSDSADGRPLREEFLPYGWLSYKAKNAKEHGAIGVIFLKTLSDSANTFYPLDPESRTEDIGIIAVQANRTEMAKYFPRHANLYPMETELQKTEKPNSFELTNSMVKITVDIGVEQKTIANIMGVVPGTDESKKGEYILITSNFDNRGPAARTEEYKRHFPDVFNDEKSTGFAGMLELMRSINESPLSRPVVFIGFNAKTFDFAGAEYFLNNPPVPLTNIFCMINLDKLDKMKRNKAVLLGETTSDIFPTIINEAATELGLSSEEPNQKAKGDYTSFYYKGIPFIRISSGYEFNLYNRRHESDDINFEGMAKLVRFSELLVRKIDFLNTKPGFVENSLIMNR
jgi:aminopeptidase YwaD